MEEMSRQCHLAKQSKGTGLLNQANLSDILQQIKAEGAQDEKTTSVIMI
jgi:hypothetical protein